jgi:3-phytase
MPFHIVSYRLAVDDDNNLVYVADKATDVIKVYQLDGTFVEDFGQGDFPSSDVEGLALYRCGADGYLIASDQQNSEFEIYDRLTHSHLATFTIAGAQTTIGLSISQDALPGYPNGAMFIQSHDREAISTAWNAIAAATGASTCTLP